MRAYLLGCLGGLQTVLEVEVEIIVCHCAFAGLNPGAVRCEESVIKISYVYVLRSAATFGR